MNYGAKFGNCHNLLEIINFDDRKNPLHPLFTFKIEKPLTSPLYFQDRKNPGIHLYFQDRKNPGIHL